jgi:hypothetical protein
MLNITNDIVAIYENDLIRAEDPLFVTLYRFLDIVNRRGLEGKRLNQFVRHDRSLTGYLEFSFTFLEETKTA